MQSQTWGVAGPCRGFPPSWHDGGVQLSQTSWRLAGTASEPIKTVIQRASILLPQDFPPDACKHVIYHCCLLLVVRVSCKCSLKPLQTTTHQLRNISFNALKCQPTSARIFSDAANQWVGGGGSYQLKTLSNLVTCLLLRACHVQSTGYVSSTQPRRLHACCTGWQLVAPVPADVCWGTHATSLLII
jgi:hypothetical protein